MMVSEMLFFLAATAIANRQTMQAVASAALRITVETMLALPSK